MGVFTDFVRGLTESIDDALKGIRDGLSGAVKDILENMGTAIVRMFSDVLQALWDLPAQLADSLGRMFKDPKFWVFLMLALGMVAGAQGLNHAQGFPEGQKWQAFMEGAGTFYSRTKIPFLLKAHRLTYLISPEYREDFQDFMEPMADEMTKAGIDITYANALFQSTLSLVEAGGAIAGQDWDITQQQWAESINTISTVTGETLQEWGQDPALMINWIDEHITRPQYDRTAGIMNSISSGLDAVTRFSEDLINNIGTFRTRLDRVARDYDRIHDTDFREQLSESLGDLDNFLTVQWGIIQRQLSDLSDIFSTPIAELQKDKVQTALATGGYSQGKRNKLIFQTDLLKQAIERQR